MTGFNLDFNDVFEGTGRIADGDYEVVVKGVKEDTTPSGAEYVEFDLVIRNDFQQQYQNSHVFHKVWKAKDTGKFNMKTFNTMGKAFQLQNGKTYKSFEELLNDFKLKTAKISLKNVDSEYNGKTYTNYQVYFNQTKLTGLSHNFTKGEGDSSQTVSEQISNGVIVKNSDLPF